MRKMPPTTPPAIWGAGEEDVVSFFGSTVPATLADWQRYSGHDWQVADVRMQTFGDAQGGHDAVLTGSHSTHRLKRALVRRAAHVSVMPKPASNVPWGVTLKSMARTQVDLSSSVDWWMHQGQMMRE